MHFSRSCFTREYLEGDPQSLFEEEVLRGHKDSGKMCQELHAEALGSIKCVLKLF